MAHHPLLTITDADVQDVAQDTIGRRLNDKELDLARRFVENSTRWRDTAADAVWFAVRRR
jgi:hypothetical protein